MKLMAFTAPSWPDSMMLYILRNGGMNERVWPAMSTLPVRFAASHIACASSRLSAIGFSTTTCLPCSSA